MVGLLTSENCAVRERTCKTLSVLARLADGRKAIVASKSLLANIAVCAEDPEVEVRVHVASLLEMIARCWMGKAFFNTVYY